MLTSPPPDVHARSFAVIAAVLFTLTLVPGAAPPTMATTAARTRQSPDGAVDSARIFGHARTLVEEIGPRPAGGHGEVAARRYVRRRLEALGLEVRTLPVETLPLGERPPGDAVIRSANVVGILHGTGETSVLLIAHLDSRNAWVPGAVDDASGVSVLLETARILARDPPATDVLFLITTAEESGLWGARHFASGRSLAGVEVAVAVDMVGRGPVTVAPIPGSPPVWALRELSAVASPRRGRVVPGWILVPRLLEIGFGADHLPFVEAGVPGFALTDRPERWWYHHPTDDLERLAPAALADAAGVLVDLVRRWDRRGVPETGSDPHYVALPLPPPVAWLAGRSALLVPGLVVRLTVVVAFLMVLPVVAVFRRLRFRREIAEVERRAKKKTKRSPEAHAFDELLESLPRRLARIVWGLLHTATWSVLLLVLAGAPVVLLQRLRGWRYPWWGTPWLYVALALLGVGLGIWLLVRTGPPGFPPRTPGPYVTAATAIWLSLTGVALAYLGWSFAFFPAVAAMGAMVVGLLPGVLVRLVVVVAAMAPTILLADVASLKEAVTFAGLTVDLRFALGGGMALLWPTAAMVAAAVSYPAATRGTLRRLVKKGWLGIGLAALYGVLLLGALATPSYRAEARRSVHLEASWNEGEPTTVVDVRSAERLRRLEGLAGAATLDEGATATRLTVPTPEERIAGEAWIEGRPPDGEFSVRYRIDSPWPPTGVWIDLEAAGDEELEILPPGASEPISTSRYHRHHAAPGRQVTGILRLAKLPAQDPLLNVRVLVENDILGIDLHDPEGAASIFPANRISLGLSVENRTVPSTDGRSATDPAPGS